MNLVHLDKGLATIINSYCVEIIYRIVGKFSRVLTFTVFADQSEAAKF